MLKRFVVLAAWAVLLSLGGVAWAQGPQATVVLKSGERVTGEFQDVAHGQVYVRTGLHTDRRVPVEQVALVDFVGAGAGLPETELKVAREPGDLLLMRDGTSHRGQLVEMGLKDREQPEESPILVVFRTQAGEELRVETDRVGRLYLGPFPEGAAQAVPTTGVQPGAEPTEEGAVRVPADQRWIPSGLFVRRGEQLTFEATGQVQIGPDRMAPPPGIRTQEQAGPGAPLPDVFAGALIGRVGDGQPFSIGDQRVVAMPGDGQLFLGVNDATLEGNAGHFNVKITRQPRRR